MNRILTCALALTGILASSGMYSQTLTGVVSDETGMPMPGATILANGGARGISTDMDGRYSLDLGAGQHTVDYSFVGYVKVTREVTLAAGQTKTLNVRLETDAVLMDDVVVVGYGVQRKKEVTGSIAQIDSKQITSVRTPSFEAALQGQAAGVQVSQSSGVAGAGSLIRVRGVASVSAAGDPLYVVDGIPITQNYFLRGNSGAMNNNPLATINPNDIESVEILKDAAATGIYGSRGANGVILITTKRGNRKATCEFGNSESPCYPEGLTGQGIFLNCAGQLESVELMVCPGEDAQLVLRKFNEGDSHWNQGAILAEAKNPRKATSESGRCSQLEDYVPHTFNFGGNTRLDGEQMYILELVSGRALASCGSMALASDSYNDEGAVSELGMWFKFTVSPPNPVQYEFSSSAGFSNPASLPNMLSTEEYLTLRQEAWENDGGTGYVWLPGFTSAGDSPESRKAAFEQAMLTNTDWVNETIGTGVKHNYSFGARKGGDDYNVYAGVSYDDNGSYLIGNSYERVSGRLNADFEPVEWAKIMVSSSLSQGINNRIDAAWSGGLGDAMSNALPYYPVYRSDTLFNADGTVQALPGDYYLYQDEWGGTKNPVAVRESKTWITTENRSINNASLVLNPMDNLFIKGSGGFDYMHVREDIYNPPSIFLTSDLGNANRYANYVLNWNYSLTADYKMDLTEFSSLGLLAGSEFQRTDSYGYGIGFGDVTGPIFENDSLLELANGQTTVNNPSQHSFLSYFGRANYTLKDRYFFQATARVDGSSRFGRNYRYGFFPSLSAGWVISDEPWFESGTLSFLKARTSWGKTGNAALPDYARFGTYSAPDNGILYNGQPILFPLQPANPNLRWETSRTVDASIEIGLWNDRVTTELAYYNKSSQDVIMNVSTPPSTGFTNRWDNVATILNRGVELSIKSRNAVGEFKWTTELNFARNYNELQSIGDYTPDAVSGGTNDSRVITGSPVGSFYLMMFSHVDAETGLPVYLDREGNETFDYDNSERQYVGDGLPDFVGGMTNTFRWKNWDLRALATFSYGAKIFDSSSKRQLGVVTSWNMRTEILDRWRQPGDEATFPRLTLDETTYGLPSGFPWWNTSLFVFDASYLRLRNLTLGYTIPQIGEGQHAIRDLRINASVTNLFTITSFPGLDPEVVRDFENAQDRNMSPNVTYLTPPQERAFTLGINLSF